MIEMLQWLRASGRSRNTSAHPSTERVNQYKFYGGGDGETDPSESREHYVPASRLKQRAERYRRAKKIEVRSKWNTRVVYSQRGTGEVITIQQTTGEGVETIYIPVEEDQNPTSDSSPPPPLNAEYILHLFLKRDERDAVIGDLLERYVGKHERFGERRARLWFYGEVVRSLWPLLKRLVARAGGLIALGEWIRRHVS